MIRKLVVHLTCEFVSIWPINSAWCTKNFAYLFHLILFTLPWKQGSHCEQFSSYSTQRKDIYRSIVIRLSEKNFWCTIPSCRYIVSKGWFSIHFFCKSEISYFYSVVVAKQIFWLEITMHIVLLMHVAKSLKRLKQNISNILLWKQLSSIFHYFVHILIKVLKHKIQNTFLKNDFVKLYNIWMC